MLVTTIIPTVGRPTLSRAANSVLEQVVDGTHELIVVNDRGAALPAAEWMEAPRVRVIATQRRERCFARNAGAAMASGRLLHFLDDDDYLLPGAFDALLEVARASGAAWVYGALQRIDDAGRSLSIDRPHERGNILAQLVAGESLHLAPALIDAETFFRVGGFNPAENVGEDYDLQCRIALVAAYDCTDKVVACVRVGTQGATTTDWSQALRARRAMRDRILDSPGCLARLLDSAGHDPFRRGRAARAYAASAFQSAAAGDFFGAPRRAGPFLRLAAAHVVRGEFWRGLKLRPGAGG